MKREQESETMDKSNAIALLIYASYTSGVTVWRGTCLL